MSDYGDFEEEKSLNDYMDGTLSSCSNTPRQQQIQLYDTPSGKGIGNNYGGNYSQTPKSSNMKS